MTQFDVGIDGYNLAMPKGTGIATYGLTLAAMLKAAGHTVTGIFGVDAGRDPALREILFFDRLGQTPETTRKQRRRHSRHLTWTAINPLHAPHAVEVPLTGRVEKGSFIGRLPAFDRLVASPFLFEVAHRYFRYHGRFLRLHMDRPPAIMHWTYPLPIELVGAPNIYTLHDLVPLKLPYTTLDAKQAYRALVAQCIARAAQVCTVSEASRADIIAEFGADPDKVFNTWQASPVGAALANAPADDAAIVENIFGLRHRGYFLYFGAIEPKKNIGRLLEGFLSLDTATPLVMVGGRGWRSEEELKLLPTDEEAETARGRTIADRLIRLDHLPRDLLLRLIRGARAVLFPSIYEGFGLPVLEAMQLGTPVLTSTTSSLPEVAGDAALLVDPYDARAIAGGIKALDDDAGLRDRISATGPIQARKFAVDRYRERIDTLYARALAARG